MGILERKERDKQEMRLMILDAAKEVFVSEGFEKASIRAIAERGKPLSAVSRGDRLLRAARGLRSSAAHADS